MEKNINKLFWVTTVCGVVLLTSFFSCTVKEEQQNKIDWKVYNDSVKKALSDSLDRMTEIPAGAKKNL